jgi:predicted transcriptional regulator
MKGITLKKKKKIIKEKSSKTLKKSCKYKTKYVKDEYKDLKQQITTEFFEMLLCIKLFHWKTHNYGAHKATDEIYEKLNSHMDRFIEVIIGKNEKRINMKNVKSIKLHDISDNDILKIRVEKFIKYLMSLDKMKLDPDLYNIRDDIVTDLNQFLYLLTFH